MLFSEKISTFWLKKKLDLKGSEVHHHFGWCQLSGRWYRHSQEEHSIVLNENYWYQRGFFQTKIIVIGTKEVFFKRKSLLTKSYWWLLFVRPRKLSPNIVGPIQWRKTFTITLTRINHVYCLRLLSVLHSRRIEVEVVEHCWYVCNVCFSRLKWKIEKIEKLKNWKLLFFQIFFPSVIGQTIRLLLGRVGFWIQELFKRILSKFFHNQINDNYVNLPI